MKRFALIIVAAFLVLGMNSCRKGATVIPRRTMTKIYAEMALADESLATIDWRERRDADTTRIYEAIFARYGYTTADFKASEEEYLHDPGRYVKMLKNAMLSVEAETKLLKAENDRREAARNKARSIMRFAPHRVYLMDTLDVEDSIYFDFDFQEGLDTAFAGPRMIVWKDTVGSAKADSTSAVVPADSVKAVVTPTARKRPANNLKDRNRQSTVQKMQLDAQI